LQSDGLWPALFRFALVDELIERSNVTIFSSVVHGPRLEHGPQPLLVWRYERAGGGSVVLHLTRRRALSRLFAKNV
jgi:hypothetical protein